AGRSDLTVLEALSGVAGSISLVSWIVLLLPQLIENYKNGRADALSLAFITTWFLGDVANLIGALWGGLLPTIIAIAIYFCFSDMILLGQTLYYNKVAENEKDASRNRRTSFRTGSNDLTQPLIGRRRSSVISRHRHDSARRRDSLSAILNNDTNRYAPLFRNIFSLLAVCAAGILGWLFAWWTGAWKVQDENTIETDMPLGAQILGYASALLYLTARIPQIIRNHQKKSCEGLSLLFFCLSLMGNITYGAGILLHSREKSYVLDNLPWLVGSLGTMIEDIIIFVQFHIYSKISSEAIE
ncbi:PQ loop repeat-domain-containing protein, partial [Trichophaea hybrida]